MKTNTWINKIEVDFFWILVLALIIPIIIILIPIIKNYQVPTTVYIILGTLLSALITIFWNEFIIKRNRKLEEQKTWDKIISMLYSIRKASELNLELIKENSTHLHLLQTGFWELSISNISLKDREDDEFEILQDTYLGVNMVNELILNRQEFLFKLLYQPGPKYDSRRIDDALISDINGLLQNISHYIESLEKRHPIDYS
ncbi:MAG: hypothetical protein ACLQG5_06235 [Methanobacterium sp.]|jgi:hypothetical protein